MTTCSHPYTGAIAGLATKHDKLPLIAPAMSGTCGLHVVAVEIDTDVFGTFAGEVSRTSSPLDTAIAKARRGMEASGLPIGIASEGSFGPFAQVPMLLANTEIVVLVDDERGIAIHESDYVVSPPSLYVEVTVGADITSLLEKAHFPSHGLIVRPLRVMKPIVKGIHDEKVLDAAINYCMKATTDGVVMVQSDLRAHHHPSRREVIRSAAVRLAQRVSSLCPECGCPGWGVVRVRRGALCSYCTHPTNGKVSDIFGCSACSFEDEVLPTEAIAVDPRHCPMCNP